MIAYLVTFMMFSFSFFINNPVYLYINVPTQEKCHHALNTCLTKCLTYFKKPTHVEHIKRGHVFNTSIIHMQNMCFIKHM